MTDENRMLAEWMGWRLGELPDCWRDNIGWPVMNVSDWHPRSDLRQAMMLLEKFPEWEISKWENKYKCWIHTKTMPYVVSSDWVETPNAAIVEAVKKAIEGE